MTLAGKRCLVIGGTSGIGWAVARRFVADGAAVAVAGLEVPAEIADEVGDGGVVEAFACDVTGAAAVIELFQQTVAALGGLDVLVHCAGASGRRHGDGPLDACSEEGWDWTLATNLRGTFLTNRSAVQHFLSARQPGTILNTASVLATSPSARYFDTIAYAAAKGGVVAMSRQAAARYARDGIRVNVLAPGLIDTPMAARALGDPAVAAFLRTKQPLTAGPGRAEDCAGLAAFLCGDDARLITGAVVPVDGGWCVSDGQYDDG